MRVRVHMYMYTCVHVYMCIHVRTCMHVCMYAIASAAQDPLWLWLGSLVMAAVSLHSNNLHNTALLHTHGGGSSVFVHMCWTAEPAAPWKTAEQPSLLALCSSSAPPLFCSAARKKMRGACTSMLWAHMLLVGGPVCPRPFFLQRPKMLA